MSKKKKKSSPAENLIESLMDDVREIQADSSINKTEEAPQFSGNVQDIERRSEAKTTVHGGLWDNLEKDVGGDIDSSEFGGDYTASVEEDDYSSSIDEEYVSADEGDDAPLEMPVGFESVPASERYRVGPPARDDAYKGPSAGGGYQSLEDLQDSIASIPEAPGEDFYSGASDDEKTSPVYSEVPRSSEDKEDKTVSIQQDLNLSGAATGATDADRTLAVEGFANARVGGRKKHDVDVKVSVGNFRGSSRTGAANVMTSVDASLAQAENLKIAQQRILELEKEVEFLRAENEELASAGEIIRNRTDELGIRITSLEREKVEVQESAQSEILILKGNLQYKENEVAKARIKVEELETRLKSDFKKIRVRERELENRLELLRAEKSALVRSKDEYILDQKRKIDQLSQELDNYRKKCLELNKTIEGNQDQFKRTERALRLALSNLEVKEESLVPLKKAE
ncbi:MAG: hypothetical protein ACM3MG_13130 [Bacillota bacterium]